MCLQEFNWRQDVPDIGRVVLLEYGHSTNGVEREWRRSLLYLQRIAGGSCPRELEGREETGVEWLQLFY